MGTIFSLIIHGILWLIVLFLLFNVMVNINLILDLINKIVIVIKNGYERIRQYIRKKSNKVNSDSRTIYDGTEFYDSSSEWED